VDVKQLFQKTCISVVGLISSLLLYNFHYKSSKAVF